MRAVIIGCGIGGAALALALQRMGMDCVVLEQAPKLEEVGAGLQLSPNGVRVIRNLGLLPALQKVAFEPHDLLYRDWQSGEVLLRNPLMPEINRQFGAAYYHAHRADLLGVLTSAIEPSRIRLGAKVLSVEQKGTRAVARLADGTIEEGDVLIGADGIHSMVRTSLFQADTPQSSGCIAWRGMVDAATAAHLGITPSAHVWMGPGYSAVIYYVSGGRKINWICMGSSPSARAESWSATASTEEILGVYRGWNKEVTELVRISPTPFVTALYDRAPLKRWVNGRIALMGDAAHAMLPYHAQGAVQSMEDAWVLARLLDLDGGRDVEATLRRYEELRMERANRVQAGSRAAEQRLHLRDPEEVEQRNARFRKYDKEFKGGFMPQQEWLFGYDAELAARGTDEAWRALRAW